MVQTAGPVDANVGLLTVQRERGIQRSASVRLEELEHVFEHRAICLLADAESEHLGLEWFVANRQLFLVVGRDALQELDVLRGMELHHLLGARWVWPEDSQ